MTKQTYLTAPQSLDRFPPGVPYIVGNEAAERFSFYGMRAILAIFMTQYLVDRSGRPDMMGEEEARGYIHLFVAGAYFFPLLGALLADWLIGKYRTILGLSLVYCAGHLVLAINDTRPFLFTGLFLIALGSGGIKPCVSAHVGDQFGARNQHLLPRIFSWFYFSINFGAFFSQLLTPVLLHKFGPHVAFGVPGILMLLATVVFWMGRNKFVHIPPAGRRFFRDTFDREGLTALARLALLYVFVAVFWALFDQTASAWVLQAERMNRNFGFEISSSQMQAVNPILILLFIPLFSYVIYPAVDKVWKLTPLRKVSLGLFLMIPAFAIPGWIESQITGGREVRFAPPSPSAAKDVGAKPTDDSSSGKLRASPVGDPAHHPLTALFDGETGPQAGWVSPLRPAEGSASGETTEKGDEAKPPLFPLDIAVRLRERRAWKIDSVVLETEFDPTRILLGEPGRTAENLTDKEKATCRVKEFEVFTSDSPVTGWTSAGRMSVPLGDTAATLSFPTREAEYVLVRIHSNHGGRCVGLGELRVLAVEPRPPEGSHSTAENVWPNVAAMGHRPHALWQVLAYIFLTAAEILVSITCLEFSYTQAPKRLKSIVMSLYLLSVSAGNVLTSAINHWIANPDGTSRLPGASYYWLFMGIVTLAAILFIPIAMTYRGKTYIQDEELSQNSPSEPET